MTALLPRRFLVGPGRLDQIAVLSTYQCRWLSTRRNRPVLTAANLAEPAEYLASPTRFHPHPCQGRNVHHRRSHW